MKHGIFSAKQTFVLKTNVDDDTGEEFVRWCRENGYSAVSECLRDLVLVAMHGSDALVDLHRSRIDALTHPKDRLGTTKGHR